jgi:hypothetical protein
MVAHNFLRVFFHVFNSEYAARDFPRIESVEDSPLYHLGETVGLQQIAKVLVAVKLIPPPSELRVITSNQKGGGIAGMYSHHSSSIVFVINHMTLTITCAL